MGLSRAFQLLKLIQRKSITPKASQEKWLKDCDIPENQPVQWRRVFTCPFKYTKCTKLITFHFKLMHRRIATNTFLNKIGIKDSNKCSFCEDEPEHLLHLFLELSKDQLLLEQLNCAALPFQCY